MSVLLPWKRNPKTVDDRQKIKRGSSPRVGTRPSLGSIRTALLVLGSVVTLFTIGKAAYESVIMGPLWGAERVWEASAVEAFSSGYSVAEDSSGLVFFGPRGEIARLPCGVDQAVTSGDRAFVLDDEVLTVCAPDGQISFLCESEPGERLLRCRGFDGVLLIRPGDAGSFGEPWCLRAVSLSGKVLCKVTLPGIPALAGASGDVLVVGLRDVAAGGLPSLAKVHFPTGEISWIRPSGSGHWRDVFVTSSGGAAYATSSGAGLLDADGGEIWSFSAQDVLWAIAYTEGLTAIAHEVSGNPTLSALSEDGTIAWQKVLPSAAHTLTIDGTAAVALCQSHVIGFSLKDGGSEFAFATHDVPLALGENVLLLENASGVYLMKLEIRRARSQ